MATTFAVLADLHLPNVRGSAQHAVLDWVIDVLERETPDLVVAVGDLTACGEAASAMELVEGIWPGGIE